MRPTLLLSILALALASGLQASAQEPEEANAARRPMPVGPLRQHWDAARDLHSAANPAQIRVTHLDLDLKADFARKILEGTVRLTLHRAEAGLTTLKQAKRPVTTCDLM